MKQGRAVRYARAVRHTGEVRRTGAPRYAGAVMHGGVATYARAMKNAVHAEWTKLRTEAVTLGLMIGVVVSTVAVGAAVAVTSRCDAPGCGEDATDRKSVV